MTDNLTIDAIRKTVCDFYGMRPAELDGDCRERSAARPRDVAVYLTHTMTGLNQTGIAAAFGRSNRHSVGLAIANTAQDLAAQPELDLALRILRERVRALVPARIPDQVRNRVPGGKTESKPRPPANLAKPRSCLKCGGNFHSDGPSHRICDTCKPGVNREARIMEGVSW